MTVLITAFKPFRNRPKNGSETLIKKLSLQPFKTVPLKTAILPVLWDDALLEFNRILNSQTFTCGIGLGEGESESIRLETQATHQREGIDEAGKPPPSLSDFEKSHPKLTSDLPISSINIKTPLAFPIEYSTCAGHFLCNFILYQGLVALNGRFLFIHLPPQGETSDEQYLKHFMPLILECLQLIENIAGK